MAVQEHVKSAYQSAMAGPSGHSFAAFLRAKEAEYVEGLVSCEPGIAPRWQGRVAAIRDLLWEAEIASTPGNRAG